MYIKRDLYLTKTPFKITYEFKWLPIQGIYCVQTGSCSNYDGKFKSVGCNKFTKLQLGKVSVILGKERILSWKGKDPFLSQERSSLQLGKVSVILGKERILSFPRKGVVCNWERIQSFWESSKGERKGFIRSPQKVRLRVKLFEFGALFQLLN